MWKCPTCGAEHMQLQDVPRATMDAIVQEVAQEMRQKASRRAAGGHARAAALTPERRREIAIKAAQARWSG